MYSFGTRLTVVDFFAFPRTGSHFLQYCLSGLFDLVSRLPDEIQTDPEAASRQNELKESALYALSLREPGAPFQPLWLNPLPNGVHGKPILAEHPAIILIREPVASLFSAWRARKRLHFQLESGVDFKRHLDEYEAFYDAALAVLSANRTKALLVRYEDLSASVTSLERLVQFINIQPKLRPSFVHWVCRFDNLVARGERSFYREGSNDAWQRDEQFAGLLTAAGARRDFQRFGYQTDATGTGNQPISGTRSQAG